VNGYIPETIAFALVSFHDDSSFMYDDAFVS